MADRGQISLWLLGAGAGWLLLRPSTRSRLALPQQARHRVAELADETYQRAVDTGHRVADSGLESPLVTGLLAFAAGAVVAMLLPPSRRENELLGKARDQLVARAQQSMLQAKESLKETLDEKLADAQEVLQAIDEAGRGARS